MKKKKEEKNIFYYDGIKGFWKLFCAAFVVGTGAGLLGGWTLSFILLKVFDKFVAVWKADIKFPGVIFRFKDGVFCCDWFWL